MYILRYFLVIIISLTLHEVGHYLAALAFRVRVSKFCLFLDPGFRLLDTGTRSKILYTIYEWVMHKPVNYWFQIIAAIVGITLLVGYELITTIIKTLKDYM